MQCKNDTLPAYKESFVQPFTLFVVSNFKMWCLPSLLADDSQGEEDTNGFF